MSNEISDDIKKHLTFSFPDMNSEQRIRELGLYISKKCHTDPTFGATKLRKILLFADVASYIDSGRPITGSEYIKLEHGPVPAPMVRILADLEKENAITQTRQKVYDFERVHIDAHRAANLELFVTSEIALVDDIISKLWNRTAADVSELSHGVAWSSAELGERIPYEAFLL